MTRFASPWNVFGEFVATLVAVLAAAAGGAALFALSATGRWQYQDLLVYVGIPATGRMMAGPNITSTVLGYLVHFWNGACSG